MEEFVRADFIASGAVQGVFLRAGCRDKATSLGLSGSAVNLRDGTVEIFVEGPKATVEEFASWLDHGFAYPGPHEISVTYGAVQGVKGFVIG